MAELKDMRVLVAELLDQAAIDKLKKVCQVDTKYKLTREELLKIIPEYNGIVIRSETQVDKEFLDAATNLKIVGRAGSGLDNIDIDYATEKGVIAANTPESNIVSAAEHTMALLLATSRNVSWDRKRFRGSELYQKKIAIIGLGRIGGLIAERVKGFSPAKVIAYDPYISDARFEQYGVEKKNTLEELVKEADFITIHTPRTKETIGIISDKEIAMMKDGIRLVNVARGGLYDEEALVRGIESGKIASVGIDVWDNEPQEDHPLYKFDTTIATPHLGASTDEAQFRVGDEAANEVIAGLKGEIVKNAVNIPSVSDETFTKLKAHLDLVEKMGKFAAQFRKGAIKDIKINFTGEALNGKEDVKVLSLITLKAILDTSVPETVNFVNAGFIAKQRGIKIRESIDSKPIDYSNLVEINIVEESGEEISVCGTVLENKYPRIVKIGEFEMDLIPEGRMLYAPHKNVPGVIGKVGLAMSEFNVNISKMIVSNGKSSSLMILSIDNNVPDVLVEKLNSCEEIGGIKIIEL